VVYIELMQSNGSDSSRFTPPFGYPPQYAVSRGTAMQVPQVPARGQQFNAVHNLAFGGMSQRV